MLSGPHEVQLYLQGSGPRSPVWVTLGTGSSDQIENQRRYWLEGRAQVEGYTRLRIVRVERWLGPPFEVPATFDRSKVARGLGPPAPHTSSKSRSR